MEICLPILISMKSEPLSRRKVFPVSGSIPILLPILVPLSSIPTLHRTTICRISNYFPTAGQYPETGFRFLWSVYGCFPLEQTVSADSSSSQRKATSMRSLSYKSNFIRFLSNFQAMPGNYFVVASYNASALSHSAMISGITLYRSPTIA